MHWWSRWSFTEKVRRRPPSSSEVGDTCSLGLPFSANSTVQFTFPFVPPPPELSLNTANFAKSAAMLGSAEDNTALSRALSQLAEVEDKMEQLHQDQAANDTFSFAELIADYIRLLGAVRVLR